MKIRQIGVWRVFSPAANVTLQTPQPPTRIFFSQSRSAPPRLMRTRARLSAGREHMEYLSLRVKFSVVSNIEKIAYVSHNNTYDDLPMWGKIQSYHLRILQH